MKLELFKLRGGPSVRVFFRLFRFFRADFDEGEQSEENVAVRQDRQDGVVLREDDEDVEQKFLELEIFDVGAETQVTHERALGFYFLESEER